MRLRIPPHVAWPAFVVLLLGISITAAVATYVLANSDGGAEVVDDYYMQGVRWNETQARLAAYERSGWMTSVAAEAPTVNAGLRPVVITVRDRDGEPVTGLRGTVSARRPQQAAVVATVPLAEDSPGVYRQQMPVGAHGLWDFDVEAALDTLAVQTTVRAELTPEPLAKVEP